MDNSALNTEARGRAAFLKAAAFCAACVLMNVADTRLAAFFSIPLYLDAAGTILAAASGGVLPGILVGYLTNLVNGLFDNSASYYSVLNVLIGLLTAFFARRGFFRRVYRLPIPILSLAVVSGGLGGLLTWCLYGLSFGDPAAGPVAEALSRFGLLGGLLSQIAAGILMNLGDKAISVLLVFLLLRILPEGIPELFRLDGLFQSPLTEERRTEMMETRCRSISLRTKILLCIGIVGIASAVLAIGISAVLYRQATIEEHIKLGQGVTSMVSSVLDPERVEVYLRDGEETPGYLETEEMLYSIRNSTPDILYVYVYQIREDGCHVVFDLDTEDLPGAPPGYVVEFDESFVPYLPALLRGEAIEPLITNDSYGWLLTVYQPILDHNGVCQCYACVDISMGELTAHLFSFLAKQISLFLGFFLIFLCLTVLWAEYSVVLPVNAMSSAAGTFAYDSEEVRAQSVQGIRTLAIHTGDEIENLYLALSKTTGDTMGYIAEVQEKTGTITKMQNGLILVLAEMVESRDHNTGDHVHKTALYVRIIMDQMRRDGIYLEELTDEFMDEVYNAAPLHDIGKIHVPDAVLNKPGRLTEPEFLEMKEHTTVGEEIINRAIRLVPGSGYLYVARDLAAYHHERWDGKGYPSGLRGEDIPLSARIMAVADVFDALISRRSYKDGFSFDRSVGIIEEESGTHFDPKVVEAFLHAKERIRAASELFRAKYETDMSNPETGSP